MHKTYRTFAGMAILGIVALAAEDARAVIKPNTTIQQAIQMFGTVTGKVSSIDSAGGKCSVTVEDSNLRRRGNTQPTAPKQLTICVQQPAELAKRIEAGGPVVIFPGRAASAVHVADGWFAADGADLAALTITAELDLGRTFPGRTEALVSVIREMQTTGKSSYQNGVNHHLFAGKNASHGWLECGNLGVQGAAMAVGDATGDKRPDLLVVTTGGSVKVFSDIGGKQPYQDVTQAIGLSAATARKAAFGDVNGDGKPDLLLNALWVCQGTGYASTSAGIDLAAEDVLDVAIGDADGDGRNDALAILADGTLLVFTNPGNTQQAWRSSKKKLWTSNDKPLAAHIAEWCELGKPSVMVVRQSDLALYELSGRVTEGFTRLTGEKLAPNPKAKRPAGASIYFPVIGYMASGIFDFNGGDGRPELVIATESGQKGWDLQLCNLGFGCFLANREGQFLLTARGKARLAAMAYGYDIHPAGNVTSLLALLDDGRLFRADSGIYILPDGTIYKGSPGSNTDLRPKTQQTDPGQ